jgi:hypothetical protein
MRPGATHPRRATARSRLAVRLGFALLLVLAATALLGPAAASATECGTGPTLVTCRNDKVSRPVELTVPPGVIGATITARGGHGSQDNEHIGPGGPGGIVDATVALQAGQTIQIYAASSGYGANSKWGFSSGGRHGIANGPTAYDGGAGGGASAVVLLEGVRAIPLVVAGGGGGGGGAGDAIASSIGGSGGAGAGGDGPGTPRGGNGSNPIQQPAPFDELGGIGGGAGSEGESGSESFPPFAGGGAGGGGGGGYSGPGAGAGGGGVAHYFTKEKRFNPDYFGAGGGGGGDSYAIEGARNVSYSVAGGSCPAEGGPSGEGSPDCEGEVTIVWQLTPGEITSYGGAGEAATVGDEFPVPLQAKVLTVGHEPVAGATVTFTLPASGPSARFTATGDVTTATAVTNSLGIATAPPMLAGEEAGRWTATASVGGVAAPARFALANRPVATAALLEAPRRLTAGVPTSFTARVAAARASAGTPTGAVAFFVDGERACAGGGNHCEPTPLDGAGDAASPAVALSAGEHQITATYAPTGHFEASHATLATQVAKARSVVTVHTSPNPSLAGEAVTASAVVVAVAPSTATPSGTVSFAVDGQGVGGPVALVGGVASAELSLGEGVHEVEARYSGDDAVAASSAGATQSVGAALTAIELGSSARPSAYGTPPTFTARLASRTAAPTGVVDFLAGTEPLCEGVTAAPSGPAASVADCTPAPGALLPGRATIRAVYVPTGSFEPISTTLSQEVDPAQSQTVLLAVPLPNTFGTGWRLAATVRAAAVGLGEPTGSVLFGLDGARLGEPVPLGADGTASFAAAAGSALPAGAHPATVEYPGDKVFDGSGASTFVQVEPVKTATTLRSSAASARTGDTVRLTATVAPLAAGPTPSGTVRFLLDGAAVGAPVPLVEGSATSGPISGLGAGEHDAQAIFADPAQNFLGSRGALLQAVVAPAGAAAPGTVTSRCGAPGLILANAYRVGRQARVTGLAPLAEVGRKVVIRQGGRRVGTASVRFDGTFSARLPLRPGGAPFRAVLAGHATPPLAAETPLTLVGEGVQGTARAVVDVGLATGAGKRLVLERQASCGGGYSVVRRLETGRGGRVRLVLTRPAPGAGPVLFRLRRGGEESVGIVVRERFTE